MVYLRLDAPRDVIEWQLDEVLDINGWDLKKTLIQFHRGNATLFEWAASPIVYRTTELWEEISRQARDYFSMKTAIYHYYGTANSTYMQYLQEEQVPYKKYFYALRPLLAARDIERQKGPAPVLFADLMKQELPDKLRAEIENALKIKMASDEKEIHPQNPVIRTFIKEELARQASFP